MAPDSPILEYQHLPTASGGGSSEAAVCQQASRVHWMDQERGTRHHPPTYSRFGTRVAPETKPQAHGTPFASQSDVGGPRAVPVKNSRPVEWVARQQISSGARAPPQNFTNSRSQLPVPSETQLMRPGALPPYSPKVEARDDRYLRHSSILI